MSLHCIVIEVKSIWITQHKVELCYLYAFDDIKINWKIFNLQFLFIDLSTLCTYYTSKSTLFFLIHISKLTKCEKINWKFILFINLQEIKNNLKISKNNINKKLELPR